MNRHQPGKVGRGKSMLRRGSSRCKGIRWGKNVFYLFTPRSIESRSTKIRKSREASMRHCRPFRGYNLIHEKRKGIQFIFFLRHAIYKPFSTMYFGGKIILQTQKYIKFIPVKFYPIQVHCSYGLQRFLCVLINLTLPNLFTISFHLVSSV